MTYTSTDMKKIIEEIVEAKKEEGGVKSLYFVGCGGSLGALYPAKTFMAVSYTHLDVYKRQIVFRKPFRLFGGAGVDAVQDGRPQGPAGFVHRQAVGAQRAGANTGHLLRCDTALFQQQAAQLAKIPPPDPFGVLLEPARLGIFHGVRDGGVRPDAEPFVDQHTAGFKSPDIDRCV